MTSEDIIIARRCWILTCRFPTSLLKVGDHGTTHQFSPTPTVSCYWYAHSARVLPIQSLLWYRRSIVFLVSWPSLASCAIPSTIKNVCTVQKFFLVVMCIAVFASWQWLQIHCLRRSRSTQINWFCDLSGWFAVYVCSMSSRRLSTCQCRWLWGSLIRCRTMTTAEVPFYLLFIC